ncbi:MAG: condensation domain-containing protein [Nostoc sp.]|uniref:condensation domain-containing protein n=1 Tax=Nostoc sp. TaxID=1180 RepID=UPI002FF7CE55
MKNIENFYPLSPMQEGILFHTLYAPDSGVYFNQTLCTLHGNLNVSAFEQAWQQVVVRHPILRTAFVWEGIKEPIQVVYQYMKLPCTQYDWQGLSVQEQQEQLDTFLETDRKQGFELTKAPLMRLTLIRLAVDTYQFVWSHHHLLLDGWSWPLVLKEVTAFYEAYRVGQDLHLQLPRPYRDYIAWLQQQKLSDAEVFWRQMLVGLKAPTPLVFSRITDRFVSHEESYGYEEIKLSETVTTALQSLAIKHQLTLNTIVQGAWALLLSRYSGEDDVVFGTTVSGRSAGLTGAESMVGLFINTLPVRVKIHPEDLLSSWLKMLQTQQIEARQYEYTPLVQIQGWTDVPRSMPLFESLVVFENYPVEASLLEWSSELEIQNVNSFEETNYPLTVAVVPGSELLLGISYSDRRFDANIITRMVSSLQTLLARMSDTSATSDRRVSDLLILSEAERKLLLFEWNNTQVEYPQDHCIHQLFESVVERTPDAVAVVFKNEQLTYRELNQQANQLAHYLQKQGVGPEVLVGICMERSVKMLVGILGILKAGGAYVPLDPTYPQERLAFMFADSGISVLLTQENLVAKFPEHKAITVSFDTNWEIISQENDEKLHPQGDGVFEHGAWDMGHGEELPMPNAQCPKSAGGYLSPPTRGWSFPPTSNENLVSSVTSKNLAYVIYTSGSTGRPKGVATNHGSLVNAYMAWENAYQLRSLATSHLQMASFSFDVFSADMVRALCSGAKLVLCPHEWLLDTEKLYELMCNQKVDCAEFVPSVLRNLIQYLETTKQNVNFMHLLVVGSDSFYMKEYKELRRFCAIETRLINSYGVSEATVDSLYFESTQVNLPIDGLVPIGRPFANISIYILNSHLQPVPIGVPGELYIGGAGLARGYINRPDLTKEKFILNPFSDEPGTRLYKTGDLARYLSDGNIELLGRIDNQVKIRGFRIELGEIEAVLLQHPDVWKTVVIVQEDNPDNKRLVAYVVPQLGKTPAVNDLRRFLKEKLPDYMVPPMFMMLEQLPLTPNGKIDRRALPVPETTISNLQQDAIAPRDTLEFQLTQIWESILNIHPIAVTDSFFDLGGHSLLAVRLMGQIQKHFGRNLPLSVLFQGATIEHLASIIRQQANSQPLSPLVAIQPRGSQQPLFFVHPVGGNVLCYYQLAHHLGIDQPFYGLQSLGLYGESQPYTRIEDMATHYIEALRVVQPQGTYLLGGWSMGGIVAFEMATQLQKQGDRVALLALIDSPAPIFRNKPIDFDEDSDAKILANLASDMAHSAGKKPSIFYDDLQQLEPDEQLNYFLEQAKIANLLPPDVSIQQLRGLLQVFKSNIQAMLKYTPQVYSDQIILFRARDSVEENNLTLGWDELSSEPVEIITVPGDHYTMLSLSHIQTLKERLKFYLLAGLQDPRLLEEVGDLNTLRNKN